MFRNRGHSSTVTRHAISADLDASPLVSRGSRRRIVERPVRVRTAVDTCSSCARNRRYAPNVRLLRSGGCSLSVMANVRAKGSPTDVQDNRPLSGAFAAWCGCDLRRLVGGILRSYLERWWLKRSVPLGSRRDVK